MTERFILDNGTISVANGSTTVTGTGTTFSGRDLAAAELWCVPAAAERFMVGFVADLGVGGSYDNLEIELTKPWRGTSIVDQPYELVYGPAIANSATQAAVVSKFNAALASDLGLVHHQDDAVDTSILPNNSLRVDTGNAGLSLWRDGDYEPLDVGSGGGSIEAADITDSGAAGRLVLQAATEADARAAIDAPNAQRIPGGRLTLTSATPVLPTTVSGATTIRYTPYLHNQIALYDGTSWVPKTFSELSQATTDTTKSPAAVANNSNYDLFVWNDSGTLRCTRGPAWTSDTGRGTGAGTTELERVDGVLVNKIAITNGPAAQRGVYVGTIRSNGSAAVDFIYGTSAAGGGGASFGVWNMYNRVNIATQVRDSNATWTYGTNTWRAADNSNTYRVSFVTGLQEDALYASYATEIAGTSTAYGVLGIGFDSTSTVSGSFAIAYWNIANWNYYSNSQYAGSMGLGFHYVQALEISKLGTTTFYGAQTGGQEAAGALTVTLRM